MSYHTFQLSTAEREAKQAKAAASRRISTSNACVECRRRKIRCDGAQPCSQCQWYQHPQLCHYAKPAQRIIPSKKLVSELQDQNTKLASLFNRVFPGQDLDALLTLPRPELANLVSTASSTSVSPATNLQSLDEGAETVQRSEEAESLDALEQAPDQDPIMDETCRYGAKIQAISDDINGLSLSVDQPSSYVGVSSINAALKVIFKTAPFARPLITQSYSETALASRSSTPPLRMADPDPYDLPPPDVGHQLIESYFNRVHVLMPMIDEDQFRHTYLFAQRSDSPWLALLNAVLALGSLASSTCEDEDHLIYYQRSRRFLDIETFGSGSLLVLQALGLLGGYYLHWLNRPNEANNLMGATLRMATALGLHREYSSSLGTPVMQARVGNGEVPVEIRRRTWWSLFCLDTWAMMSTGRPSLGRSGPGITVKSPQIPEQTNNAQYLASMKLLPIVHNIEFCKLCTKIVDKIAGQSLLKPEELFALDAELYAWREDLPPILRDLVVTTDDPEIRLSPSIRSTLQRTTSSTSRTSPLDFSKAPSTTRTITPCPDVLRTPRAVMYWWYLILRVLMHRPYLLSTSLRRKPLSRLSPEEKLVVTKCRHMARTTIHDIPKTCESNLIAGWNAVWIMYQAVMVPLVSIFSSSPLETEDDEFNDWSEQIETAIDFFDSMVVFSVAAKKSRDVVRELFGASRYLRQQQQQQQEQQQQQQQQQLQHQQLLQLHQHQRGQPDESGLGVTQGVPGGIAGSSSGGAAMFESPNGEAALASFWDEMMWDTLPEMPFPAMMTGTGEGGAGEGGGGYEEFLKNDTQHQHE